MNLMLTTQLYRFLWCWRCSLRVCCGAGHWRPVSLPSRGMMASFGSAKLWWLRGRIWFASWVYARGWFCASQHQKPKTRGRSAKHQSARVDPRDMIDLITAAFGQLAPEAKLWPWSAATLRKRFNLLLSAIGLPSGVNGCRSWLWFGIPPPRRGNTLAPCDRGPWTLPSPRKMALIEGHGNLPSRSYCNHLRTEVAAGYKIEGSAIGFSISQVAEAVYAVFEHGHPT